MQMLMDGHLLLMDAGCERHGYASDVTRTWPVGRRYSDAQRRVYRVALDAHKQCMQRIRWVALGAHKQRMQCISHVST